MIPMRVFTGALFPSSNASVYVIGNMSNNALEGLERNFFILTKNLTVDRLVVNNFICGWKKVVIVALRD